MLHQLLSVLHPIVIMTKMAQSRKEAIGWKVLMRLHQLMGTSLDPSKMLRHFDSEANYYTHNTLSHFAQTIRSRLADSVSSRVFKRCVVLVFFLTSLINFGYRYDDSMRHSLIFDQQVYLNPVFKDMSYLKAGFRNVYQNRETPRSIEARHDNVIRKIHQQVEQLAIRISTTMSERDEERQQPYPGAEAPAAGPLNQFSSSMLELMDQFADPAAINVDHDANEAPGLPTHFQAVRNELMNYSMEQGTRAYATSPLTWWYKKRETYPLLSRCARIIFSVPASSGPLELDIGHTGMIVTKHRTSLSGSIVEAMTMLNRNRNLVDLTNVDTLSSEELRGKLPKDLAVEHASGTTTLFEALDVHLPDAINSEVGQMMDVIAFGDADDSEEDQAEDGE